MTIHQGFVGHGIFLQETPSDTLGRYSVYPPNTQPVSGTDALTGNFIKALNGMGITNVWLKLFGRGGDFDSDGSGGTAALITSLKAANITPVGWGYCHHKNAVSQAGREADGSRAMRLCKAYGITAFVADIEPDNPIANEGPDTWDQKVFVTFVQDLNTRFGKDNLAISTFSRLDLQPSTRQLMPLVSDSVCMFAPQAYWTFSEPIAFTTTVIDSWRNAGIQTPLVATAEAYWDRTNAKQPETPIQSDVEAKLGSFVTNFPDTQWSRLIGLNWYYAGDNSNSPQSGAMSDTMIADIVKAKINKKPFAPA